jgi:hypothetical protein
VIGREHLATAAAIVAAVLIFIAPFAVTPVVASASPAIPPAASAYLEGCGGCHGVEGHSLAERVPDIAGKAGFFMCTQAGREYLIQLPNVAFAHLDSTKLAAVMNFVVFDLGRGSAPHGAKPFTPSEVAVLRAKPIDTTALVALRTGIVTGIVARCPKAANLNAYGGGL